MLEKSLSQRDESLSERDFSSIALKLLQLTLGLKSVSSSR